MLRYGYLGVGLGGVGWGNDVHVNLPTHVMLRYCYVLLHLHTHVMLRYGDLLLHLLTHVMLRYGDLLLHLLTHGDLLLHLHTHVMLRYGCLGVGLGGVGAITFMSTCTHTSCYVIVMFSCTCTHTSCYVMVIFSCTCSHTSCYVMVIFSCTCSHTSCYAMVIFSCTCTHTSCAPLFLQMETVLGSHMPKVWKSNMPKCLIKTKNGANKCEEPPFFPVHCGRDANRWQMVERPFQDGCMMESTQKNTLNWKVCLGLLLAKSLGPLTPYRFLEELCKAVKAMKRFWEEGKKCCIPKKHELVKKRSSFGDFQHPIFHVNMRKNDVSLSRKRHFYWWKTPKTIRPSMGREPCSYIDVYLYIYILHIFLFM